MARRIKLELEHEWPYRILGITATIQDYRLAHFISQKTGLLFQRQEDLSLDLPSKTWSLPLYTARDKELRVDYIIIPNRMENTYLIPAEKRFDYFLIAGGDGKPPLEKMARTLQKTQHILFCHSLELEKWRDAPYFFHDLEMNVRACCLK